MVAVGRTRAREWASDLVDVQVSHDPPGQRARRGRLIIIQTTRDAWPRPDSEPAAAGMTWQLGVSDMDAAIAICRQAGLRP
jgi:hypothetical protein